MKVQSTQSTFSRFARTTLLVTALAAGFVAPVKAATELNLAILAGIADEDYDGAQVFKNYVETASNGSLVVKIFAGAQLCGSAPECFESMKAGVVDIYNGTAGGASVIYKPIQALDIPYMFSSDRVVQEVLQGPLEQDIRARIMKASQNSIMLMSIGQTGGWRGILTKSKQIRTPEDMKGLKIRTIESPIQQTLVRNMGASPTPLPWSEVYTAATTGVIEGSLNSISDVTSAKLNESMKYLTLDRNAYMTNMWFIGNAKFQKLTAEEKKIVLDGSRLFANVTFGVQPWKELKAYEDFRKSGGKVYIPTAAEAAKFRELAKPIREWYLAEYKEEGKDFLGAVEKYIAASSKTISDENTAVLNMK
jgi:TRAP-type C4-dicarboxylate transport system substrate-binding protein